MYIHMYIHFRIIFTSLWDHFGVTLRSLWGHFGVTLWSLWGHSLTLRVVAVDPNILEPCLAVTGTRLPLADNPVAE